MVLNVQLQRKVIKKEKKATPWNDFRQGNVRRRSRDARSKTNWSPFSWDICRVPYLKTIQIFYSSVKKTKQNKTKRKPSSATNLRSDKRNISHRLHNDAEDFSLREKNKNFRQSKPFCNKKHSF